jgi:hypothetical protein
VSFPPSSAAARWQQSKPLADATIKNVGDLIKNPVVINCEHKFAAEWNQNGNVLRLCLEVVIFLLCEPANNISQFCRIEIVLLLLKIIMVGNGREMTYNAFVASDGMIASSVAATIAHAVVAVVAFGMLLDGQSAESGR